MARNDKRRSNQPEQTPGQSSDGTSKPAEPVDMNDVLQRPSPEMMEQIMAQFFGGDTDGEPTAQDLARQAVVAAYGGQPQKAIELAQQALDLDPACVDALLLMAHAASETREELIQYVNRTVEIAAQTIGEDAFEEMRGHFWGFHETRPYMSARAFLAELLADSGREDEAIEHYEQMLALNPGDNQAMRYPLMGLYLSRDNLEGARWLFGQYEDEGSAVFVWSRVLERFLAGELAEAEAALREARETNPHVEPMLRDNRKLPREKPDFYGMGDRNEAIMCAHTINHAWKRRRKALAWLKQQG